MICIVNKETSFVFSIIAGPWHNNGGNLKQHSRKIPKDKRGGSTTGGEQDISPIRKFKMQRGTWKTKMQQGCSLLLYVRNSKSNSLVAAMRRNTIEKPKVYWLDRKNITQRRGGSSVSGGGEELNLTFEPINTLLVT